MEVSEETEAQTFMMAKKNAGFSILEVVIVIALMLVVIAFALPNLNGMLQSYRAMNDVRGIAAQLSLARMRAAATSQPARLNFDLTANTYQLELCTSLCNTANAIYAIETGAAAQNLSQGVTFGSGSVISPAVGQTTLAQSSLIFFNSRGVSVDSTGSPIGTAGIYITNSAGRVYAVTVSIGGQPTTQQYVGGTTWKTF